MTPNNDILRVLIIHPEQNLRVSLAALVGRTDGFECVGICSTTQCLEADAARHEPDLVLIDAGTAASLPPGDMRRLHDHRPETRVILLDLEGGRTADNLARRLGADGFVSTATVAEELDRLRVILDITPTEDKPKRPKAAAD